MQILKVINLTVAFLLEIGMLISLGYYGFLSTENIFLKYTQLIILPLMAIVLWGFFAAPKSKHRLTQPYRMFFALVLFAITAFLLYKTGRPMLASAFGIIALLSQLTAFVLKH